jgi:hypothetical protein
MQSRALILTHPLPLVDVKHTSIIRGSPRKGKIGKLVEFRAHEYIRGVVPQKNKVSSATPLIDTYCGIVTAAVTG